MTGIVDRAICWIRRDLRTTDHAALALATRRARNTVVVFVFDTTILNDLVDRNDRRITFIYRALQEINDVLRQHGSELLILHGAPEILIPTLATSMRAQAVFTASDYEPYAISRDRKVHSRLDEIGIHFESVKDSVIFEGGEIYSQSGTPFRVYTPYSKAWRNQFILNRDAGPHEPDLSKLAPSSIFAQELPGRLKDWSLDHIGFKEEALWLPTGQSGAQEMLSEFTSKIDRYGSERDFPAKGTVSALGVHFRFGTLSTREAVRTAIGQGSGGADKWLAELIWRDFYQDLLFHHPHVVETTFQPQYRTIEYPGSEAHYWAWCEGKTGYPLIDAAMRCLNTTGYMHNRLRMVVASFLTKDLLIDYKKGEAWFARQLLDFDLASNNGGWQWAASVGADAQPYFRIFNPILQSKRFDEDGDFIRHWLPELAELPASLIHFPAAHGALELASYGVELGFNYPLPLVDHDVQRELAIKLLESARS